jgi:3-phytase
MMIRRRLGAVAASAALLVGSVATVAAGAVPASGPVPAKDETQSFSSGTGDIADDPAIWVDPHDSSRSVVIGSKKSASGGGLAVYDLSGDQIQFLSAGELNNVDLRPGVFAGRVLLAASNRTSNRLSFFFLDPSTRTLASAGSVSVGFEPYGACLYVSPITGDVYAFVTENRATRGQFDQYRLTSSGSTVTGTKVRDLSTSSLSEGCVADDEGRGVFLSQEDVGLFRYAAEPGGGTSRTTVDLVSGPRLAADVEGVAIAHDRNGGPSYLVVSSQGDSTFQVYDLQAPHTHRKSFTIVASGSVDGVTGTDGVAVTRADLGPLYPDGLLVAHDTSNSGASVSNFKYVDGGVVLGSYAGVPAPSPTPADTTQVPSAPTSVVATADSSHRITVTAQHPGGSGVSYVFTEVGSPGVEWVLSVPTRTSPVLATNRTYQYYVAARNAAGTSAFVPANPVTL